MANGGGSEDTIIHYLLGGLAGLATLMTTVLGWLGKDAYKRLKALEEAQVTKLDVSRAATERAEIIGAIVRLQESVKENHDTVMSELLRTARSK